MVPLGLDARRKMGEGRRPPGVERLGESGGKILSIGNDRSCLLALLAHRMDKVEIRS
jgi:hypothetical protein